MSRQSHAKKREYYLKNREKICLRVRAWSANNKGKVQAANKKWREKNKEKVRGIGQRSHLRKKYGMTKEDYAAILEKQGGACAICGTQEWQSKGKRPVIDHDHKTGKTRGILCHNCNVALGLLGEDIPRIESMIAYIRAQISEEEIRATRRRTPVTENE